MGTEAVFDRSGGDGAVGVLEAASPLGTRGSGVGRVENVLHGMYGLQEPATVRVVGQRGLPGPANEGGYSDFLGLASP